MKTLATTATLCLLMGPAFAGDEPRPAPSDPGPILLGPGKLDQVTAGKKQPTPPPQPFHFVIYNHQRSDSAPELFDSGLTVIDPSNPPGAVREHILLARQVGIPIRD